MLPEEARRQVGHDQGTARGDNDHEQGTSDQQGPLKTLLRVSAFPKHANYISPYKVIHTLSSACGVASNPMTPF